MSRTQKNKIGNGFMKKVFLVVTAALAVISLAACGPGSSKKNPEKSPKTEQKQKNKYGSEQSPKKQTPKKQTPKGQTPKKQTPKKQMPKKQEPNQNKEKG
ncbi:hypothetical protein D922_04114, partial [Enterococcus faecalis 06-MB-DW-09]